MHNKYQSLTIDLASVFSRMVALPADEAAVDFAQQISHPLSLERRKKELLELFSDPDLNWLEFGFNDDYEIMCDETAEDVRNFIIENIWNVVFPDTPPPSNFLQLL